MDKDQDESEIKDVFLAFVRLIGEESDGYFRYEFIFTDRPDEVWEDGFDKCKKRDVKKKMLCDKNGIALLYYSNIGFVYPYNVFEDKDKLINIIKNGR